LNQIKQWIATCTKEHASCKSLSSSRPLPKRVLDVQGSLLRPKGVFLYEPKSDEKGSYVALSHCWGDQTAKPLLKITRSTMESRRRGIAWLELSKSFRDAIAITRKLGIRYLWIDSLCIIQDDREDWELEAMKMGSVYGNAYLVLAATAAADGDIGCIFPRPISQEVRAAGHIILARICPWKGGHQVFINPHEGPRPPLFNRAWAYQERLLATRILHFCAKEVIWECKAATWCECKDGAWELESWRTGTTTKGAITQLNQNKTDAYKAMQAWDQVLEAFSCCALTHDSDRLPALSSLAEQFAASAKLGRYVAGLWEEFLIEGLQWQVAYTPSQAQQKFTRRPSTYCAPSWSWASVVSAVIALPSWYPERQENFGHIVHAKVIGIDYVLSNPKAPFGAVMSAELSIRGILIPATFDSAESRVRESGYRATLVLKGDMINVQFDLPLSGTEVETYYCFWLETSYDPEYIGEFEDNEREHILVLKKNAGQRCTYRRVGFLTLMQKNLSQWWFEDARKDKEETIMIL
jgi:hypothetical protein